MSAVRALRAASVSAFSAPALALAASVALLAACRVSVEATPSEAQVPEHLPALNALGPYSAAVASGDLVFVSGKIGAAPQAKPDGTPAVDEGFSAEVDRTFDAIERDLQRLRLQLDDVVSATVYLTDMARYAELNAVYARRMKEPYPARTCVAVAALPAGARVEIAVVVQRR